MNDLVSQIDVSAPDRTDDDPSPIAPAASTVEALPAVADWAKADAAFKRSAATSPVIRDAPSAPSHDTGSDTDITV